MMWIDINARDLKRSSSIITVCIEPGSTCYLLSTSAEDTEQSLRAEFSTLNFETEFGIHSPDAGTTIQIILTGVSVGAGIVATEFLKETGKKLWNAFERLLSSKSKANDPRLFAPMDTVKISLKTGDSSLEAQVAVGLGSAITLQAFLTESPNRLFAEASRILGAREHCPICLHDALAVTELPCRYCIYNGDKLRMIDNVICNLGGVPVPDKFRLTNRRKDYFEPIKSG